MLLDVCDCNHIFVSMTALTEFYAFFLLWGVLLTRICRRLPQLQASIIVLTNEVQASLILYSWHVTVISMSQLCSKFKFSQPYLLYAILWVYPSMTFIVAFYDMYLCLLWHCIEYKMMCIAAFYDLYGGLIWLHIASTYIFLRQFDSNSNV